MNHPPVLILSSLFFCSCASVKVWGPAQLVQGRDGTQRLSSMPVYAASGIDRLPMQDIEIPGHISIREHMPPGVGWPTQRATTTNRDGSITVTENPLYASNASNTTNAIHNLWSGVVKSVAAAGFATWSVLGLGAQATSAQIASTKADANVANTATKAAASVEKTKILAPIIGR